MSKTPMSIQMLEILYSRGVVGIAELARLLETNPRNIPEYKKVLEEAGYVIDTIPGRYGGYVLNKKYIFPATNLTDAERDGLLQGFDYLLSRNDFMRKDDFSKAMAKISSALMATDTPENTLVANRFPLAMPEKEIRERYLAVSRSIAAKTVMQIKYLSLSNEVSAREFHPYKLFMYNNTWYTIGFDEKSQDFRYFKLNRIQSFEITGKPFRVPLTYNERDFLDEYGMKQNGEWYPIKLKIAGKYAMLVKERIYGKNKPSSQSTQTPPFFLWKCRTRKRSFPLSSVSVQTARCLSQSG
jgi:predicted DNA-binding transcriptional regulator YafY